MGNPTSKIGKIARPARFSVAAPDVEKSKNTAVSNQPHKKERQQMADETARVCALLESNRPAPIPRFVMTAEAGCRPQLSCIHVCYITCPWLTNAFQQIETRLPRIRPPVPIGPVKLYSRTMQFIGEVCDDTLEKIDTAIRKLLLESMDNADCFTAVASDGTELLVSIHHDSF